MMLMMMMVLQSFLEPGLTHKTDDVTFFFFFFSKLANSETM